MTQEEKETPEHCLAGISKPCRLHPVDCSTCKTEKVCQQKDDMKRHSQIKSCPHYRRRAAW